MILLCSAALVVGNRYGADGSTPERPVRAVRTLRKRVHPRPKSRTRAQAGTTISVDRGDFRIRRQDRSDRSICPEWRSAIAIIFCDLLPQKTGEPLDRRPGPRQHSRAVRHRPLCRHPGGGRAVGRRRHSHLQYLGELLCGSGRCRGRSHPSHRKPDRQCVEISAGRTLHAGQVGPRLSKISGNSCRRTATTGRESPPRARRTLPPSKSTFCFHITRGEQAHVGEVKVTGTSSLSARRGAAYRAHESWATGLRPRA